MKRICCTRLLQLGLKVNVADINVEDITRLEMRGVIGSTLNGLREIAGSILLSRSIVGRLEKCALATIRC